MTKLKEVTATTKELAELFDVTPKYVSQLVLNHGMPKAAKNKFNFYKCVKWRFDFNEKSFEDRSQKIREENTKSRLERANAELKELDLAEKRGELVQATAMENAWLNEIAVIDAELEGLAIKAAPNLLGIKSVKKMKDKLIIEINKIRTKIAKLKLHTVGTKSVK